MVVLYFSIILLSSLFFTTSFSFYGLSFYGWLAAFILLLPFVRRVKKGKVFIIILPAISIMSFFLSKGHELDGLINNVKLNGIILITVGAMYLIITSDIMKKIPPKIMSNIIAVVMITHVLIAFFQFVYWYAFGGDLDVSSIFGGSGHRSFYYGIYRITGVFDEPAIYSTFIMSFCFLRFYLMGRNDWVNYVGVVSIILSLSFAGIVIVFLYLLVSETWDKKIIFISIVIFVVCLFVASFYPEIYGSVLTRLETLQAGNDGSSNLKFQYVNFWLSDEQRILFGNGMVGYYDGKPKFFESAFDLTFIFTTITTYGVVLSIPLFLVLYYYLFKGQKRKNQLLLLIISLKMTSIIFPFFWVFSGIIIAYEKNKYSS